MGSMIAEENTLYYGDNLEVLRRLSMCRWRVTVRG